ncbi:MAG: hypothetical protein ISR91_06235 [Candidatus Delongbacteria bacterium]|nr:hypothetical protein [Candidatus Delongbacteria bacterium]
MRICLTALVLLLGTITGLTQPLNGLYDLGGGNNDYSSFNQAVLALQSFGVSGPVSFAVYGGDYNEAITLTEIIGADATSTITFSDASGQAHLNYNGPQVNAVITLDGADYFTFDGIDLTAGNDTRKCVRLENTAQNNCFLNATYTGNGTGSSISHVGYALGANNDHNRFANLVISDARVGFRFTSYSGTGQQSRGIIIENCQIHDVWNGVYSYYQEAMTVRHNDIQLNAPGNTGSGWGVHIDTQLAGDTTWFYGNSVHNIVTSGGSSGSGLGRIDPSSGVAMVFNNFCYDFQTSGTAQIRAIYAEAGDCNIWFNSIRIDDVVSTGNTMNLYCGSSSGVHDIRNNIFFNAEGNNTTYGFYALLESYAPDLLDYNVWQGSGGNYLLGKIGSNTYGDLTALQQGTELEANGLEGDPGFTSQQDLHIADTEGLVSNNGISIALITHDIDEDTRGVDPDRGADEYYYLAPAADYALLAILNPQELYPELTEFIIQARVKNRGSEQQIDTPVRLFFADELQDEVLVSLLPEQTDTVDFSWTTPAAPAAGNLEVQAFLEGDADPTNDSLLVAVTVVGLPLHGLFTIGGDSGDYTDFSSAVSDLELRGIDASVTFEVQGTLYQEQVTIGAVAGASTINTITFIEAPAAREPVSLSWNSGAGTLVLSGAHYLTFDGIDITATNSNTRALALNGNCDYNTIRNCLITGSSVSGTSFYGVYLSGGNNDFNTLDNITVSGAGSGIRLSGSTGDPDMGNVIRNSTVLEGKYAVYLEQQDNLEFHHCDIQPGWTGAATEVYGFYIGTNNGGEITLSHNRIHNIRTSGTANAIRSSTGSSGYLTATNNFIYDFQVNGSSSVYGLRVAGGNAAFLFNNLLINDGGSSGNSYGYYQSGSAIVATLRNNILAVNEAVAPCWSIYRVNGALDSDYNCYYSEGPGAGYNLGYDGGNLSDLAAWQTATGQDNNSLWGDPGFVGSDNLHIQPGFGLLDGVGLEIAGITTDFDDEVRGIPPDLGADEYEYDAQQHDFSVNSFINLGDSFLAGTVYPIEVEVENLGTADETDCPVLLYYNQLLQDTQLVTLGSGAQDTVTFSWTTPDVGFQIGELAAIANLPGDSYAANDTVLAEVLIYGAPMSGNYDLGGGNLDFADFQQAVTSLLLRGVSGEVTINCYDGTYTGPLELPAITGSGVNNQVTFRANQSRDLVILTATGGEQVLYLNGADFINFDAINLTATAACDVCLYIANDADNNSFSNLAISGRDEMSTSVRGVKIDFESNDNLLFDNITVSGCYYGIRNEGGSSYSQNLEVRNSTILDARYGCYLDNANQVRIHHNDIQPGTDGSGAHTYGVYISSLGGENVIHVYNNRFHNIRNGHSTDFYTVAAVESHPTSEAVAYIYNNFVYDFTVTAAKIHAFHLGSGTSYLYHNSVLLNDVEASTEIAGLYIGTGSALLADNIFVLGEAEAPCYGIMRSGLATLNSDYNCFHGSGPGFNTASDGGTPYPTLADWQLLGYDVNSIAGDPGYISEQDLHIDPDSGTIEGMGIAIPLVTFDFDDELRGDPPDIGADEYEYYSGPDAVDDLVITISGEDAYLTWTAVPEATSYRIYLSNYPYGIFELLGVTSEPAYLDVGVVSGEVGLFYQVTSSDVEVRLAGDKPAE